ncbi:MAG: fibronectin type III domain-containing protein [Bacteroidales bacterium]|nr:fibronectin type III domain-containing protein [Bacteroidales bacterium]
MPTGLTSSNTSYISADISWTAPSTGTPSGYEWEVRSSGLGGSGATGLVASGSTTHPAVSASVAGLSGGTSYTLYVRTFCGGSDDSTWASNTFSTLSCSLPTGVVTSAVTASSANLTWVAPVSGSPEGYEWEVRSSGAAGSGATGLAASGSTTSPVVTASASGLTSATAYSVYVRTMCYSGFYSGWTTAVSFTTQCSAEPAPTVVQDFTTYTGTAPAPICWSEATGTLAASSTLTYGSSEWTSSAGFANAGTNKGVKVNLYSTGNDWIISQPIDLGSTAGLYRVKYRIAVTSYNGTVAQSTLGTHKVDVVISTDGGATWSNTNVIRTYTGAGSYGNTGQEETINLTSYSGVVKFAIVESTTLSSPDIDFHFDDFVVEELPSCVGPTSLSATNVTLSSATLNWMVYAPVLSEYEVRTSGLPGSGGEIASGSTGFGVSTANVTGLSSNTTYLFYVRSNCGVGSFSTWTGPYYFFTGYCTPAPSSVDGSGITRVVYSTVNNPTIAESGNYGNYTALVGNVGQGMTIPVDITFTTGYTYDTKIWIDWNDDLDFSDSGEEVYTGTSLAASPTTLNASFIVPLTATLGNHRMRIGGLDVGPPTPCYTGTYGSYEDYTVNVVLPPSCLPPSGLAASNFSSIGADLTWTSPDSFFDIFIETFGSPAPETGTTPTIDDNEGTSYTWKDGSPATAYQYFVRADCGQDNTDVSDWAGPFAFTTLCETISVFPYTETFSGGVVPPTCWSEIISNNSYNWKYNSTNGGFADVEYDPEPANQDEWLVSPEFDFSGLTHPRLTFDWLSSYYWFVDPYDNADFVCNISLDGGGTWTPIWDEEDEGVFTNYTWYTKRIDLTLYAGEPSVKFAYRYVGYDAAQSGIDNFKISEVLAATWTGATSSVWSLAGNWNPDVPGANTNVIIPGGLTNYPTLTAAASCNNFTIQSGGSFIGSEFLTVGGTTTIERSIGAYSAETASDGWHLVSSPVANQAISGAWTPATGYDFYALDESVAEYWLNQKNHAEMTSFIPGEGYLVAYEVAGTKTFSGALNTTAVTLSGLTNTPGDYAGSHLVGNPFTSAINSASFTGTNVAANVQVWNSTNAAYEVAATIPALNGFMVYTTGAGELTIPLAARTHTGPAWFKSGSEDMILLQANDTERNMAQKSIVRFNAQATEAFDMEFDAYYLAGFAPMFYSKSADEGFALNTLPVLTNETVIPFDFIKNESSEFNIEMVQAVPGAIIYLTDKKANKVVNLTESHTYHFTAVEGDLTDRFLLSFGAVGIDNPDASVVNIYAYHDKVFVNGAAPGSEVKITNLLGQEMIRTSVNGIELKTINAGNLANGVYVVSIISGNNVVSKKVVLEK